MEYNDPNNKVAFEDSQNTRSSMDFEDKPSKMVSFVMRYSGGMIQDKKQANLALLIFAALMIALMFYLFFGGSSVKKRPPMTAEQRSFMQTGHGLEQ